MTHEPVLAQEALAWLAPREGDCIVDCTAGAGGHAEMILGWIRPSGRLVAIDRDPEAVLAVKERLRRYADSLTLVCDNYRNLAQIRARLGLGPVRGILMDCGASSPQFDAAERGFSFRAAGPLDMRMDRTQGRTLAELLRDSTESEIEEIIRELGQERHARRIARTVKRDFRGGRIRTTQDLADAVWRSVPSGYRHGRIHPATRTFQAFRISVNDELGSLGEALDAGVEALAPGGRFVVLSFHSLEDGLVKRRFREAERRGLGKVLVKKPLRPSETEVRRNPRARSARLRVFEKGAAA